MANIPDSFWGNNKPRTGGIRSTGSGGVPKSFWDDREAIQSAQVRMAEDKRKKLLKLFLELEGDQQKAIDEANYRAGEAWRFGINPETNKFEGGTEYAKGLVRGAYKGTKQIADIAQKLPTLNPTEMVLKIIESAPVGDKRVKDAIKTYRDWKKSTEGKIEGALESQATTPAGQLFSGGGELTGQLAPTMLTYGAGSAVGKAALSPLASSSALPTIGRFAPQAGQAIGFVGAGQLMHEGELEDRPARALTDVSISVLFSMAGGVIKNLQVKNTKVDLSKQDVARILKGERVDPLKLEAYKELSTKGVEAKFSVAGKKLTLGEALKQGKLSTKISIERQGKLAEYLRGMTGVTGTQRPDPLQITDGTRPPRSVPTKPTTPTEPIALPGAVAKTAPTVPVKAVPAVPVKGGVDTKLLARISDQDGGTFAGPLFKGHKVMEDYPELGEVAIDNVRGFDVEAGFRKTTRSAYDKATNTIYVSRDFGKLSPEQQEKSLLHELGHAIDKTDAEPSSLSFKNGGKESYLSNKREVNARDFADKYLSQPTKGATEPTRAIANDVSYAVDKTKLPSEVIRRALIEEAKQLPLKERGKLLAAVKNTTTPGELKKVITRIENLAEQSKAREIRGNITKELKKVEVKKVSNIPRGKFGDNTVPLMKMKKALNLKKADAEVKIRENIEKYGTDMPTEIALENEALKLAGMGDMNPKELTKALERIKELKAGGKTEVQKIRADREAKRDNLIELAKKDIPGKKPKTDIQNAGEEIGSIKNPVTRILSIADDSLMGYRDTLSKITKGKGTDFIDEFTDTLHSGRQKEAELFLSNKTSRVRLMQEATGIENDKNFVRLIKSTRKRKLDLTTKDADGKAITLKMNEAEAMKYLAHRNDPTLQKNFEAMRWTPEIWKKIESFVRPELKKVIDVTQSKILPDLRRQIAPVYKGKTGISMPNIPNYYPGVNATYDSPKTEVDSWVGDLFRTNTTAPTAIRSRTGNAYPIKKDDFFDVLERYTAQANHFIAFDEPTSIIRGVLKNEAVRREILLNSNKHTLQRLETVIEDLVRGNMNPQQRLSILDGIIKRFTISTMAVNPLPALKQQVSLPAMGNKIGFIKLAQGSVDYWAHPVKWTKLLWESPILRARLAQGFDYEMGVALTSKHIKQTALEMKLKDALIASLKMPTRGGDILPILSGGTAIYKVELSKALAKGMSKEAAHKAALKATELQFMATQQSPYIEDLSWWHTHSSFTRLFVMYKTSPIQLHRTGMSAIRDAKSGRGSWGQAIRTVLTNWYLIPMLFQLASDGGWDSKKQKRVAVLGPWNNIPMGAELTTKIYNKMAGLTDWGGAAETVSPIVSLLEDIWDAFDKATKISEGVKRGQNVKEDAVKLGTNMFGIMGKILGYPASGPQRTIQGIYDLSTGETEDPRRLLWSEWALEREGAEDVPERHPLDSDSIPMDVKKEMGRVDYTPGNHYEKQGKTELTVEDQIVFSEIANQKFGEASSRIIKSEFYKKLSDEDKKKIWSELMSQARAYTRTKMGIE
jgi:hypothetical protein